MKGYKTSKDYKRLKELLDAGNEVIISDEYGVNLARLRNKDNPDIISYDFGDFTIFSTRFERFEDILKSKEIEFIEPTDS